MYPLNAKIDEEIKSYCAIPFRREDGSVFACEGIVETYSCGPCRMCVQGCNSNGDCRAPELRLFALESCGFWVNHLCRKASEYPLYGDSDWEIEWLTDWELPTQYPPTYRSVTGVLLG